MFVVNIMYISCLIKIDLRSKLGKSFLKILISNDRTGKELKNSGNYAAEGS